MRISKFNHEGYYDPTTYRAFKNIEKDEKRAWAPGLYDAAMRCYASFQLPQEAGLAL